MKTFTETFNCRYPIACMAMNQVSDLNLAVAVRSAGCLPSLSVFNYYVKPGVIGFDLFEHDLTQYAAATGDTSILISTDVKALLNSAELLNVLLRQQVAAIEIILDDDHVDAVNRKNTLLPIVIKQLQSNGIIIFVKTLSADDLFDVADGIILKGPDGAGRSKFSAPPLTQLFDQFVNGYSKEKIIVSGGVGNSTQLKYYMDHGAFGVGIGTMFAVSAESKISLETKLKLITAGAADVKRLDNGRTANSSQNAVIFKTVAGDNNNNTHGLRAGIKNPDSGHVFIGRGIEHTNEILTCEQIVQRLVKGL